jgi:two-component system chemotaxis sensor kinase CheA
MDLSKYAALFLAESREHLSACNTSLLQWERAPAAVEPVDRVFRAIHTIKGMAATMGYAGVAQLAHAAENLLDALRHSRVIATPAVFQLLFKAVDTLGGAVEAAAAGSEQDTDASLIADLDTASAGNAEAGMPTGESTVSASAELGRAAEEPRLRRASDAPKSRPVQIIISRSAVMRGARAALVVRRAETLVQ